MTDSFAQAMAFFLVVLFVLGMVFLCLYLTKQKALCGNPASGRVPWQSKRAVTASTHFDVVTALLFYSVAFVQAIFSLNDPIYRSAGSPSSFKNRLWVSLAFCISSSI